MSRTIVAFLLVLTLYLTCGINTAINSPQSFICPEPCRCSEYIVDCSGTKANTTVIKGVPANTKVLNFSSTYIANLTSGLFSRLEQLEVLDLCNSSLSHIDNYSFKGLKRLKYLNISTNDNIPLTNNTTNSSLFSDLTLLKELHMYGTTTANLPQQYSYPNEALSNLISLESLWMDGMSNRSLGMDLSNLTKLRTLRFPGDLVGFGFCNIDTLNSDMFNSVTNITHLHITNCGIQELHNKAFATLRHLEFLDLSGNVCLELDSISNAFKGLTFANLSVLVLNHIYYTSMNSCGTEINSSTVEGFKNLTLKELYLEDNAITVVKKSAFEILPKSLKYISVKNNEYEPDINLLFFKELENLETIDASYQFFPNMIWAQPKSAALLGGNTALCRNKLHQRDSSHEVNKNEFNVNLAAILEQVKIRHKNSAVRIVHQNQQNVQHICSQPPIKLPPIIPYIPKKLIKLDVSHSKIDIPVYNFTVDSNNVLKRIYASHAMLICWEGPVYGLNKLEYLDLRDNLCKRVGSMFFSEFRELKVLLLANNLINADVKHDTNGTLLERLTKLEVLDISNNGLTYISKRFLLSQKYLQTLNISSNQLEEFSVYIGHMLNLSLLNISRNSLNSLSEDMRNDLESIAKNTFNIAGNNLHVDLTSNYIHCYCVNLDFLLWLKKIFEGTEYHLNITVSNCFFEDSRQEPIDNLSNLTLAINFLEKQCASKLPLIIGITIGVVVVTNILVGVTVYRYRWKLRYWYYVSRNKIAKTKRRGYIELRESMDENGNEIIYDVFLPYTTEEEAEKFTLEIINNLVTINGLRVCYAEKDFIPGQSDYRMIGNAVHVSRTTIFIVTKNFSIDDKRWEIAMRFCEEEACVRGKRVSFCIFIDGIPDNVSKHRKLAPVYNFIKAEAFLEYPGTDPEIDPRKVAYFWEKFIKKVTCLDGTEER